MNSKCDLHSNKCSECLPDMSENHHYHFSKFLKSCIFQLFLPGAFRKRMCMFEENKVVFDREEIGAATCAYLFLTELPTVLCYILTIIRIKPASYE